jgi:hypothetical protein
MLVIKIDIEFLKKMLPFTTDFSIPGNLSGRQTILKYLTWENFVVTMGSDKTTSSCKEKTVTRHSMSRSSFFFFREQSPDHDMFPSEFILWVAEMPQWVLRRLPMQPKPANPLREICLISKHWM